MATQQEKAVRRVDVLSKQLTADAVVQHHQKVVAFGSVCTDTFWYFKDLPIGNRAGSDNFRLHIGAKIPSVNVEEAIGGSAANVATGLVKLGIPTALFAAVGQDSVGKTGIETMKKRGVDTAGIVVVPGKRSDQSTVLRSTNNPDRTILTYKGATLSQETVKSELVSGATLFLWTSVGGKNPVNAIKKCMAFAKQHNIKVAAAPSQAMIMTHRQDMLELLAGTHCLSLNDVEIMLLTDTKRLQDAIAKFLAAHPLMEVMQVTRGKNPSILVARTNAEDPDVIRIVRTRPPPVKPVDTTGAGDSSCAGLVYAYLMHSAPEMIARTSITTSTSKVLAKGATGGLLNATELHRLLNKLRFEQLSFTTTLKELANVPDSDIL
eukprot:TRINITY_DN955_c0_g2_i1.p1 TRINITY_DN955_c0_g2~~TRINITY_DN955_c0_g2_i1.p1  ORF type:complete len:400 (-),score=100.61 TRINITY_DN955_c0_g2_i1:130-1263(-)